MAEKENTFLTANDIYEEVEGETGSILKLEEDQQSNLVGIIKSRFAQAEDKRDLDVKEIIEDLEIESMWQLTQSARHHSKSYKKKFYYSFEQNKTDNEIKDNS